MAPSLGSGRPLLVLFERCTYEREVENIAQLAYDAKLNGEEVVKKVISKVYQVDNVNDLLADVAADNTEENQVGIKPLDTFMVSVLHSNSYKARVKAVPHTDISTGVVFPHPFYLKHRIAINEVGEEQKVRYSTMVVYMLNLLYQQNSPQLSNCFLQVLEATFNCVARHKEVFEYMISVFVSCRSDGGQLCKAPSSPLMSVGSMFNVWLDSYKRQALFASIINPLLFLHQNCYSVFENLASHGVSFWAAAIQAIFGIPMPFEQIPDLDRGWSWGALKLNESNPLVQKCVSLCMASPNTHWKTATSELKPPPAGSNPYKISQEYASSMKTKRRYTSLPSVLSALESGSLEDEELREYAAPLQRFLFLCSPGKVQEAFLQYVMNCAEKFPALASFSIPSMFDIDDDGNIAAAPTEDLLSHLRSSGVDLESCKCVSVFSKPTARRSSVCTTSSDSSAPSSGSSKKKFSSILSSLFSRMICNGKTTEETD